MLEWILPEWNIFRVDFSKYVRASGIPAFDDKGAKCSARLNDLMSIFLVFARSQLALEVRVISRRKKLRFFMRSE